MDYGTLKADIAEYSHRTSDTEFVAAIPGFVTRAYSSLNSVLRLVGMEQTTTLSFVDGQTNEPPGFLETRSVTGAAPGGGHYELPAVSQSMLGRYVFGQYPIVYAMVDGIFYTAPALTGDLTLNYYEAVPVPVADLDTDVFLTRYETMTFDACMEWAGKWQVDLETAGSYGQAWRAAVVMANRESARTRLGSNARATRPSRPATRVTGT
ncbi:MAG: hypothetical protein GY758_01035 [Fuerstiella sp.]|nr:hypothetical protein [Fuerstiella sp.]